MSALKEPLSSRLEEFVQQSIKTKSAKFANLTDMFGHLPINTEEALAVFKDEKACKSVLCYLFQLYWSSGRPEAEIGWHRHRIMSAVGQASAPRRSAHFRLAYAGADCVPTARCRSIDLGQRNEVSKIEMQCRARAAKLCVSAKVRAASNIRRRSLKSIASLRMA